MPFTSDKEIVFGCIKGEKRSVHAAEMTLNSYFIDGGVSGLYKLIFRQTETEQISYLQNRFQNNVIILVNDGSVGNEMKHIIAMFKKSNIPCKLVTTNQMQMILEGMQPGDTSSLQDAITFIS